MIASETWCALHALSADYWRRVDRQSEEPVDQLYTEDGRMQIGTLECAGRKAIAAFFEQRNQSERQAGRTTRHCATNLHVESAGPARWRVRSTVMVLSGHGEWPMASAPPSAVGDFEDLVVRAPRGCWLFASRQARIVFAGAGAASFAR